MNYTKQKNKLDFMEWVLILFMVLWCVNLYFDVRFQDKINKAIVKCE